MRLCILSPNTPPTGPAQGDEQVGILEELAWFRAQVAEQDAKPAIPAAELERVLADFAEVFGPEGPAQEGAR